MAVKVLRSSAANKRPLATALVDGQLAANTEATSPGLFFKNASGSLVKVGPCHVGTTAPNATPASGGETGNTVGEQWLDTSGTNPILKIWNGSTWVSETGEFVSAAGDTMTGALVMDNQQQIRFRELTANGTNHVAVQAPASLASDLTVTLPSAAGTLVGTGDTGTVTNTMLAGSIADSKLNTISTAGKVDGTALTGTIPSTVLGNSTTHIGTTAVALNRASASQALTGISSIALPGATSGTVTVTPAATAGTTAITIPATSGTLVTTGDSGTVTSTMIANGTIVDEDINASAAIAGSKIQAATTTNAGAVQLTDSTSSTSTTTAATPNSVKSAYDLANAALPKAGGTVTGNLEIGNTGSLTFEGSTANDFELTLAAADVTADRTITLPDATGTVVLSGSIANADISATAEISVSKLADGDARQLLQTAANGTDVEWTSNIDIPGTLDVTGQATFDQGVYIAGSLVLEGTTADDFEVTIACEPTADRTITLPNATTTLAGLSVAQTFTAAQTLTDPIIIGTITEDIFTISDGAGFEIDPANGSIQLVTLGANRTPKGTNFVAGESVTLMVADGTAFTLTWTDSTWGGSGVVWVGGTAPTLATSGYTVIQLWKVGTQVYGARVGDVA